MNTRSAARIGRGTSEVSDAVIAVENLQVSFRYSGVLTPVVRSASFAVGAGETVGLVGESGSGKTVTAMAMLGLIRPLGGEISNGRIMLQGKDVTHLKERQWSDIRGQEIAVIFQQAIRSLNPAFTVGEQLAESVRRHVGLSRKEAWTRAVEMLDRVHIARPAERATMYPHQLSGGMCQRAMIAMALMCSPKVLIADEPTTALDVTVQRHILALLREIQAETGVAIVFITHDLGVIAQMADSVAVMYAGEVVEQAGVRELFEHPRHPYTEGLLASIPTGGERRLGSIPGRVPAPTTMPGGCRFHPRCSYVVEQLCTTGGPHELHPSAGGTSQCLRSEDLNLVGHTVKRGATR
ncbi:MAG TPA: ABC transporter ATP-binding protein [Amycolatopsis sp.]|nr:ABC transporter ATP-binding protein [Amycolatopsis sp.]